jgi:hypothetical protein
MSIRQLHFWIEIRWQLGIHSAGPTVKVEVPEAIRETDFRALARSGVGLTTLNKETATGFNEVFDTTHFRFTPRS